jgi:acyl CoA:acetate/3-ketoacid CoA transferase beta subunit
MMDHCNKKGAPKFIPQCTLPLTGKACIDMLVTDLGVFEMNQDARRFQLIELAPEVTLDDVRAKTTATFDIP